MANTQGSGADIQKWDPENEQFWESTGKKIANRNFVDFNPQFTLWLCSMVVLGDYHGSDAELRFSL